MIHFPPGRGAWAANRHLQRTPDTHGTHQAPCNPSPEGPLSLWGEGHQPICLVSCTSGSQKEHRKEHPKRNLSAHWCACPLPHHHGHIPLLGLPPSCCLQTVRATALLHGCLQTGKAVQTPAGSHQETSPERHRKGQSKQLRSTLKTKPCPQQASEQGVNG